MDTFVFPSKSDILAAAHRISPYVHRTPVLTSQNLDEIFGCHLYFKCENLQKAGAFKSRGANNAVFSLDEDSAGRGVATHSSGNHAAALARAAKLRGIDAHIVMPSNSSKVKVAAVKHYGGKITFCEPNLASRESTLEEVLKLTGAVLIHPYNDFRIIAGQATATLELLEDFPDLDIILSPVGGGGLLSGTALSAFYFAKKALVIATEPEQADDAFQSFYQKKFVPSVNPNTIADGLRTSLGTLTFPIISQYVESIVTVSEVAIIEAMKLVWERMKIIIEPSSAVPVAALIEKKIDVQGKHAGIILSGGNVDLDELPWM
ncbi:MAG: pyridoxal-phosphate dependent enzyme [Bacteroidales bacterium]|nr:pyridoxal-phosphate dependent enzyme [Bacteroidales bacterium]